MPAFLSSDQFKELTQRKAIIELDVYGFGIVSVDENVTCEYCGGRGIATMPHGASGCIRCTRMDFTKLQEDAYEAEVYREVLEAVPKMLADAKAKYHRRYGKRV
jgi:hypothetical protein